MGRYLLRRTFVLALSLIAAGLVLFVLLRLLPGDPAAALLSVGADEAQIAAARAQVGSDQPVWVQLGRFLSDLARFDLGNSFVSNQPVLPEILARLNGSGTRCTADADKTFVVQNIVRNLFFFDIISHLVCCPEQQRMVFYDLVRLIPFQLLKIITIRGMLCSEACNPDFVPLQSSFQRMNFSDLATFFPVIDRGIKRIRAFFLNERF